MRGSIPLETAKNLSKRHSSLTTTRSSRKEAQPVLDQWLPLYQPFRASWQTALGSCRRFLHPLYSCRTAAFPQYGSVMRAFTIPIVVRRFRIYPPHWLQRRKQFRGGSLLVMLRPARWLGRLASPRQRRDAADRPARLRQSLPQPGSPPAGVCYHYSAQPPIAEAGLAPASMAKVEGCT